MVNTTFPIYSFLILIGVFLNNIIIVFSAYKYNYSIEEILQLILYELVGIIFGAKIFSYITNYNFYNNTFNFFDIGMSSYGAIIGILVMLYIYTKQFKKNYNELLYIFLPCVPLMYGIGKIGCYVAGCCRGFVYNGYGAVIYKYGPAADNLSYFPIQIVEAVAFLIIFIYLMKQYRKKINNNTVGNAFILCGIAKFLLDYLRLSHVGKVITINQIFSLIFIFVGIYVLYKNKKYKDLIINKKA